MRMNSAGSHLNVAFCDVHPSGVLASSRVTRSTSPFGWPSTAAPILTYGEEITGCVNRYGRGSAYLIGTLLGHGELAFNESSNRIFLSAILSRAGVRPDGAGKLTRRRRVLGNQAAWFFFNSTNEPVEEVVSQAGFRAARDLLGGDLPAAAGGLRVRVEPVGVRCLILED